MAHLCTRVTKNDEDDWRKLIHLMNYLKKTIGKVRFTGENSTEELFTLVDAAYAVHDNMKSQT